MVIKRVILVTFTAFKALFYLFDTYLDHAHNF